ncbi:MULTISPECIES: SDR family oxidoreductase [unclassified Leeuwenhoekiella]|uniref:SDR family oxidoreductase n=1 Tax=unclassified Leeuwenhoekiella TaxID=2615029 RepID=UPI000C4AD800|nr:MULTISPECIES: SDR family oxidoreductase [unclassified Leeuwenhoekiella]MAW93772.1 short-chain dehydrogenase [Leeuwenhoekiella sp.]MBA80546.1 short-chain dehydrogenase [Leeuwenhoekiella sp.]|tara:strand:+ start:11331 stop:12140 length:810 start_codon:yes stop_codon:yes gene_type:complete
MVTAFEFNTHPDQNVWALILGGSSGLGLASAKKLAQKGLNICIVHRTRRSKLGDFENELETMRAFGVEVAEFNTDALSIETIQKLIDFFKTKKGHLQLMLHSIAKGNLKPIYSEDSSEATLSGKDFMLTAEAMAVSLYDWASAFANAKLFAQHGKIIAFTSEGSTKPLPNYAAVSAAKAALEAIIRSLAFELAPLKITANCIQAGVTNTESLRLIPGSDLLIEQAMTRNPNKRLTTVEDVANAVYLLTKPEANWINGAVIPVDGGEHLR